MLNELYELSNSDEQSWKWEQTHNQLKDAINNVLVPCGIPEVHQIKMKSQPKSGFSSGPVMNLFFQPAPTTPISVFDMGNGIAQLIIILTMLIECGDEKLTVFLEEPETNMHPALLRRFADELRSRPNVQFVISTHSNVLIDSIGPGDRLYHFQQAPSDGACIATRCKSLADKHSVLDSLGVTGSMLLQTNCVVWVEGPTDRMYLNKWISLQAPDLREGSDYSIVFYAGSILKHFGFEETDDDALDQTDDEKEIGDLISMIGVCRFSAVVMDRDLPPSKDLDKMRDAKKNVLSQAKGDETHRVAVVTDGREIENDLPRQMLMAAIETTLKLDGGALSDVTLTGKHSFTREIAEFLVADNGSDEVERKAKRLSNLKTAIATQVLAVWADAGDDPPGYVKKIIALIRRSQSPEAVADE